MCPLGDVLLTSMRLGNMYVLECEIHFLGVPACSAVIVHASAETNDPFVSPTQPWDEIDRDREDDCLREARLSGFLHVFEYVCQSPLGHKIDRVLFLQQDRSCMRLS